MPSDLATSSSGSLAVKVVERNDLGQHIEQEERRNGGEGMGNSQHFAVFLRSSVPLVQSVVFVEPH